MRKSRVVNCHIAARRPDEILFTGCMMIDPETREPVEVAVAHLDGYAIVPREQFNGVQAGELFRIRVKLDQIRKLCEGYQKDHLEVPADRIVEILDRD